MLIYKICINILWVNMYRIFSRAGNYSYTINFFDTDTPIFTNIWREYNISNLYFVRKCIVRFTHNIL